MELSMTLQDLRASWTIHRGAIRRSCLSSRISYSADDDPLYYETEEKPHVKGLLQDLAGFDLTGNGHAEPSLTLGTLYPNKHLNDKTLWRSMAAHP
jgi:hypothetical protein